MDHDGPDGPFKRHVLGLVSERGQSRALGPSLAQPARTSCSSGWHGSERLEPDKSAYSELNNADDRIHQLENEVARLHESLVMLREDTLRMSQQSSPALKVSNQSSLAPLHCTQY